MLYIIFDGIVPHFLMHFLGWASQGSVLFWVFCINQLPTPCPPGEVGVSFPGGGGSKEPPETGGGGGGSGKGLN